VRVPSESVKALDERQRIVRALAECGQNRVKAAQLLGIPRRTFYRRLSEYGIA
jgi:DNA-binding NtrC family response regulator